MLKSDESRSNKTDGPLLPSVYTSETVRESYQNTPTVSHHSGLDYIHSIRLQLKSTYVSTGVDTLPIRKPQARKMRLRVLACHQRMCPDPGQGEPSCPNFIKLNLSNVVATVPGFSPRKRCAHPKLRKLNNMQRRLFALLTVAAVPCAKP